MSNNISVSIQVTGMRREFQTGESIKQHSIDRGYPGGHSNQDWDVIADLYNNAMRGDNPEYLHRLDQRHGFYSAHLERQLAHTQKQLADALSTIAEFDNEEHF